MRSQKRISGERLDLAVFSNVYITKDYLGWINDPEVTEYLEVGNTTQTMGSLKEYTEKFNDENNYMFAIIAKPEDIHIGNVTLQNIDWFHKYGTEGIMIGRRDYWGKGYATEARRMMLRFAFFDLGLNKVVSGAFADNLAGLKSNAKLGYQREGLLRKQKLLNGQYRDEVWQGLLKEEFILNDERNKSL